MRYMISDPDEVAMLLAQIGHESLDLSRLIENLNYTSAERIRAVWPSRFRTIEDARPYTNNPGALANAVYCDRMGNGPEESGEGWRFRGRGPLMLTGAEMFEAFEKASGWPVVAYPDLVAEDPRIGAMSACWYWKGRVRMGSIQSVTRQINGGLHGIADRIERFEAVQAAIEKVMA